MGFSFFLLVLKGQVVSVNFQLYSVPLVQSARLVPRTIGKPTPLNPKNYPFATGAILMVPQWPRKNLIGTDFFAYVAKLVPEREKEAWFALQQNHWNNMLPVSTAQSSPDTLLSRAQGRKSHIHSKSCQGLLTQPYSQICRHESESMSVFYTYSYLFVLIRCFCSQIGDGKMIMQTNFLSALLPLLPHRQFLQASEVLLRIGKELCAV